MQQTDGPITRRLREIDRRQGWLARKLGVSSTTVSRWISGELPILPHRRREIALVLDMHVEDVQPDPRPTQVAA